MSLEGVENPAVRRSCLGVLLCVCLTWQQVVDSSAGQPLENGRVGQSELHTWVVTGDEAPLLLVTELGVAVVAVGARGQEVEPQDL